MIDLLLSLGDVVGAGKILLRSAWLVVGRSRLWAAEPFRESPKELNLPLRPSLVCLSVDGCVAHDMSYNDVCQPAVVLVQFSIARRDTVLIEFKWQSTLHSCEMIGLF